MLFAIVHSQRMLGPEDLSADITGVGDIAGDVIGFNVCHYISPPPFLSTYFAFSRSVFSVRGHIFTYVHQ